MLFKTFLGFVYVVFGVIILIPFATLAFLIRLFGFKKSMTFVIYKIAQGWAWLLIKLIGSKLSVTGREHIPPVSSGGVCFVSNHTGYFDIAVALAVFGRPIGFIAKKELSYIPLFNIWIWLLGGSFVDRKNPRKAMVTIKKGIEHLKAGGGMVIFPEGTRSKGQGFLPFRPGSFKLATQAGVPVVPVAITGSYDTFEKTGKAQAVTINVVFSAPIETAGLSPEERKHLLSEKVHGIIAQSLEGIAAGERGSQQGTGLRG